MPGAMNPWRKIRFAVAQRSCQEVCSRQLELGAVARLDVAAHEAALDPIVVVRVTTRPGG